MREGEAHEREIHVYIHIYIYTFAHSGVRQVSNAIINYPTVFCYRACAPPYLSSSPSLCILHSLGIRDSNPCLSISRFFFLQHRKIRIGSLLFRGEEFFLYFLPLFFSRREDKFLDRCVKISRGR